MKKMVKWKDKTGWHTEVYKDGKLIDWRNGLTKKVFDNYMYNYKINGYLSEGTKHCY